MTESRRSARERIIAAEVRKLEHLQARQRAVRREAQRVNGRGRRPR